MDGRRGTGGPAAAQMVRTGSAGSLALASSSSSSSSRRFTGLGGGLGVDGLSPSFGVAGRLRGGGEGLRSTASLDLAARVDITGNIVVSGGNASFTGFTERLDRALATTMQEHTARKVKIYSPNPTERRIAAWLGGSVVGSLGSFHDLWLSREEYDENGPLIVNRKCFL